MLQQASQTNSTSWHNINNQGKDSSHLVQQLCPIDMTQSAQEQQEPHYLVASQQQQQTLQQHLTALSSVANNDSTIPRNNIGQPLFPTLNHHNQQQQQQPQPPLPYLAADAATSNMNSDNPNQFGPPTEELERHRRNLDLLLRRQFLQQGGSKQEDNEDARATQVASMGLQQQQHEPAPFPQGRGHGGDLTAWPPVTTTLPNLTGVRGSGMGWFGMPCRRVSMPDVANNPSEALSQPCYPKESSGLRRVSMSFGNVFVGAKADPIPSADARTIQTMKRSKPMIPKRPVGRKRASSEGLRPKKMHETKMRKGWQQVTNVDAKHGPARRRVREKIERYLKKLMIATDPSSDTATPHKALVILATKLEARLYDCAPSFEAYSNPSTLVGRLRIMAMQIGKRVEAKRDATVIERSAEGEDYDKPVDYAAKRHQELLTRLGQPLYDEVMSTVSEVKEIRRTSSVWMCSAMANQRPSTCSRGRRRSFKTHHSADNFLQTGRGHGGNNPLQNSPQGMDGPLSHLKTDMEEQSAMQTMPEALTAIYFRTRLVDAELALSAPTTTPQMCRVNNVDWSTLLYEAKQNVRAFRTLETEEEDGTKEEMPGGPEGCTDPWNSARERFLQECSLSGGCHRVSLDHSLLQGNSSISGSLASTLFGGAHTKI